MGDGSKRETGPVVVVHVIEREERVYGWPEETIFKFEETIRPSDLDGGNGRMGSLERTNDI